MIRFKTLSISLAILLSSFTAHANEEYLERFAQAMGLYDQIAAQQQAFNTQGSQVAMQQHQQVLAMYPEIPEELQSELNDSFEKFISKELPTLFDVEKMVSTYLDLISVRMTKEEIVEVTAFYESDLGQKFTTDNTAVMGEWGQAMMVDAGASMNQGMEAYVTEQREIISRYKSQ